MGQTRGRCQQGPVPDHAIRRDTTIIGRGIPGEGEPRGCEPRRRQPGRSGRRGRVVGHEHRVGCARRAARSARREPVRRLGVVEPGVAELERRARSGRRDRPRCGRAVRDLVDHPGALSQGQGLAGVGQAAGILAADEAPAAVRRAERAVIGDEDDLAAGQQDGAGLDREAEGIDGPSRQVDGLGRPVGQLDELAGVPTARAGTGSR